MLGHAPPMRSQTVEEALRALEDAAALLVYAAESGMTNQNPPDPRVLSGVADVLQRMTETLGWVRATLPVDALNTDLSKPRLH